MKYILLITLLITPLITSCQTAKPKSDPLLGLYQKYSKNYVISKTDINVKIPTNVWKIAKSKQRKDKAPIITFKRHIVKSDNTKSNEVLIIYVKDIKPEQNVRKLVQQHMFINEMLMQKQGIEIVKNRQEIANDFYTLLNIADSQLQAYDIASEKKPDFKKTRLTVSFPLKNKLVITYVEFDDGAYKTFKRDLAFIINRVTRK